MTTNLKKKIKKNIKKKFSSLDAVIERKKIQTYILARSLNTIPKSNQAAEKAYTQEIKR